MLCNPQLYGVPIDALDTDPLLQVPLYRSCTALVPLVYYCSCTALALLLYCFFRPPLLLCWPLPKRGVGSGQQRGRAAEGNERLVDKARSSLALPQMSAGAEAWQLLWVGGLLPHSRARAVHAGNARHG